MAIWMIFIVFVLLYFSFWVANLSRGTSSRLKVSIDGYNGDMEVYWEQNFEKFEKKSFFVQKNVPLIFLLKMSFGAENQLFFDQKFFENIILSIDFCPKRSGGDTYL